MWYTNITPRPRLRIAATIVERKTRGSISIFNCTNGSIIWNVTDIEWPHEPVLCNQDCLLSFILFRSKKLALISQICRIILEQICKRNWLHTKTKVIFMYWSIIVLIYFFFQVVTCFKWDMNCSCFVREVSIFNW